VPDLRLIYITFRKLVPLPIEVSGWQYIYSLCFVKIHFFDTYLFGNADRLCGLVVRVLGYRYGGPGSIPGTTRKKV
jgi:hypothetical protein